MTEAIGKTPIRSHSAPLRGTQPLVKAEAPLETGGLQLSGDRAQGVSGSRHMQAFARQQDPLEAMRFEARQLIGGMNLVDQVMAERMLKTLEREPAAGETFSEFRDKLKSVLAKFKELVDKGQQEQRVIRAAVDMQWQIFYQSLERYLSNLEAMAKIEASVLAQKQSEARSQSKFTERLLSAAAALAPEHRFSLLSAQLSQRT